MVEYNKQQEINKMTKLIKFEDIKTKEEVLTRVEESQEGLATLSVGNKWHMIKDFFSKEKKEDSKAIMIYYTAGAGKHSIVRYL